MYYELIRPALFQVNPETAHHLSLAALYAFERLGRGNPLRRSNQGRASTVMGLDFPNPVGLAAGLDKNGEFIDGLAALGFGFIEIGTVTPRPQAGNLLPRLFRLPQAEAIINRMGFNNKGVDRLLLALDRTRYSGILGINIGKNRDTPVEKAVDDYVLCLRKVYSKASYVTVNISSPNTPGLRDLQGGEHRETLLARLAAERETLSQELGRRVPLTLKISPDMAPAELEAIADSLIGHGIDGVIATNTTTSRAGVEGLKHGDESGGLSGRPLLDLATDQVRLLSKFLNGRIPIIAVGGICHPDDAKRKLDAGASLVQIYTGLIYHGPELIWKLVREL